MSAPTPPGSDLNLTDTLEQLLASGSTSNPTFNRLVDDYAAYHATLVVVGGGFLLALLLFDVFCWRNYRRSRARGLGTRTFERKTYLRLGLVSVSVTVLLALVVVANLGNALSPRTGFSGVVTSLGSPPANTSQAELQLEFSRWLQTGNAAPPPPIADRIEERLAWQQPKAIITGGLLMVVGALGARTWRALLRASRAPAPIWDRCDRVRLAAAIGSVPVCLLLMLMVIGNTQASVAPLTMTMLFG